MIGSQDLMVGLVIVLVLFGAKKLPELAGSELAALSSVRHRGGCRFSQAQLLAPASAVDRPQDRERVQALRHREPE